jgi:hypothetical protein
MIGPTILGRHLHAFNYQRFDGSLLVDWHPTPGFLIGKVQAKFGKAAKQNNAGA